MHWLIGLIVERPDGQGTMVNGHDCQYACWSIGTMFNRHYGQQALWLIGMMVNRHNSERLRGFDNRQTN